MSMLWYEWLFYGGALGALFCLVVMLAGILGNLVTK